MGMKIDFSAWKNLWKITSGFASKHKTQILTGMNIAFTGLSVVASAKGTADAQKHIAALPEGQKPTNFVDTFKESWKYYLPAGASFIASAACAIASEKMNLEVIGTMSNLLSASEVGLNATNELLEETVGKEKADEIKQVVAEKQNQAVVQNVKEDDVVLNTGDGHDLMLDALTGQLFYSSVNHINEVRNEINDLIVHEYGNDDITYPDRIYVREYYERIRLRMPSVFADYFWSRDNDMFINFESEFIPSLGKAAIVVRPRMPERDPDSKYRY